MKKENIITDITLRKSDDEPAYNVMFNNQQGEQILENNIKQVIIKEHNDYNIQELLLYFYEIREGAIGIGYCYPPENQEYLQPERIIIENMNTGGRCTLQELTGDANE